jgi:hypothetical protein
MFKYVKCIGIMNYIKYLNYFNLVCGTILLWTYIRSSPIYFDYYLIVGFALTIWYNWETLKQLKGQTNKLNRVNWIVGLLTIAFGVLLILAGMGMIKEGLKENLNKAQISMGALYVPFGLTTIFLTLKTLKYFKTV